MSNTNRTLAEFNGVGLENFTYLAEYDAYYHFHGDTNYWNNVHIVSGERKDGLICLYYEDTFMPNGWKCVTLRNTPSGEYLFVSNTPCERPAVPTAYPAGEPWMTIPLDGLSPYEPQALEVERRGPEDADRILYRFSVEETGVYDPEAETVTDARRLVLYQSVDGAIRAAVENQTLDCFLTLPERISPEYAAEHFIPFHDLLGHSGVTISYNAQKDGEYYTTFNDYYTVDESGAPCLLARAYGNSVIEADLDGDGWRPPASTTPRSFSSGTDSCMRPTSPPCWRSAGRIPSLSIPLTGTNTAGICTSTPRSLSLTPFYRRRSAAARPPAPPCVRCTSTVKICGSTRIMTVP